MVGFLSSKSDTYHNILQNQYKYIPNKSLPPPPRFCDTNRYSIWLQDIFMKYINYLFGVLGIIVSYVAHAEESWKYKAHCIIYKNNKIIKKTNCIENGSGYSRAMYYSNSSTYKIQGFGKITTSSNSSFFHYLN